MVDNLQVKKRFSLVFKVSFLPYHPVNLPPSTHSISQKKKEKKIISSYQCQSILCETITNCVFTTRVNQKNKNKNHNGKETKMNCTNKNIYISFMYLSTKLLITLATFKKKTQDCLISTCVISTIYK